MKAGEIGVGADLVSGDAAAITAKAREYVVAVKGARAPPCIRQRRYVTKGLPW
jgi:hypothetical protein